ncbi:MAG: DUF1573 domain-containing protein [Bacteroidetes bacterium]|nr:DUF1573 domain-containing protein [Bacteroidota bacterium]
MLTKLKHSIKNPFRNGRVFCFCLFFTGLVAYAQPQLKFTDTKKSFGFVKKGEVVTIEFQFTNTGNQPAVISDAKAECSCTTVEFPHQPIAPNQSATIMVKFDTKSVYDRQDRIIEIISNAKNSSQKIRFKGVVLK